MRAEAYSKISNTTVAWLLLRPSRVTITARVQVVEKVGKTLFVGNYFEIVPVINRSLLPVYIFNGRLNSMGDQYTSLRHIFISFL